MDKDGSLDRHEFVVVSCFKFLQAIGVCITNPILTKFACQHSRLLTNELTWLLY